LQGNSVPGTGGARTTEAVHVNKAFMGVRFGDLETGEGCVINNKKKICEVNYSMPLENVGAPFHLTLALWGGVKTIPV